MGYKSLAQTPARRNRPVSLYVRPFRRGRKRHPVRRWLRIERENIPNHFHVRFPLCYLNRLPLVCWHINQKLSFLRGRFNRFPVHINSKSPGAARLKHKRHLLRKRLAVYQPPGRFAFSVSSGPARYLYLNHQLARQGNSRPNWALNLTLCGGPRSACHFILGQTRPTAKCRLA